MSDVLIDRPELEGLGVYEFGWHDPDAAGASAAREANSARQDSIHAPSTRRISCSSASSRRQSSLGLPTARRRRFQCASLRWSRSGLSRAVEGAPAETGVKGVTDME